MANWKLVFDSSALVIYASVLGLCLYTIYSSTIVLTVLYKVLLTISIVVEMSVLLLIRFKPNQDEKTFRTSRLTIYVQLVYNIIRTVLMLYSSLTNNEEMFYILCGISIIILVIGGIMLVCFSPCIIIIACEKVRRSPIKSNESQIV